MLALPINQPQGYHFGSSAARSGPGSSSTTQATPTPLCPAQIMNSPMSRRSMIPPQGNKRPKLSLQTSILPQPVSPALPLSCSADTPTSRNTLANSFRSPAPALDKADEKSQDAKECTQCPYGLDSIRRGILKNTPLAKLIRSRREENDKKRAFQRKAKISFVSEPEVIPRPPEDAEFDSLAEDAEIDITPAKTRSENCSPLSSSSPASERPAGPRPRSDSSEWHRLRAKRSVNEGRELRSIRDASDPCIKFSPARSMRVDATRQTPNSTLGGRSPSPNRPPRTPETPSPLRTRRWVWTIGDDFNGSAPGDGKPGAGASDLLNRSAQLPRCSASEGTLEGAGGADGDDHCPDPRQTRRLVRVPTGFRHKLDSDGYESTSSSAITQPETPSTTTTTTPMTPLSSRTAASSVPESPATPRSVMADSSASDSGTDKFAGMSIVDINSVASMKAPLRINVPIRTSATMVAAASEDSTSAVPRTPRTPRTPRSVPLPETPRT